MTSVGPGVQLELPFEPPAVMTAFLVVINADGSSVAHNDLTAPVPTVSRPATLADMRRGCVEVVADIAAAQAADTVMERMSAAAHASANQQQSALIRAELDRRSK